MGSLWRRQSVCANCGSSRRGAVVNWLETREFFPLRNFSKIRAEESRRRAF